MICGKSILSKKDAEAILKNIDKEGKQYRKEKRSYYCDECKGWHLTSSEVQYEVYTDIKTQHRDKWRALLNNN